MYDDKERNRRSDHIESGCEAASESLLETEARLDPAAQAAMERCLSRITAKAASGAVAGFNAGVLACLRNPEIQQPAGRLIIMRLRWMTLSALIGFAAMYGFCQSWARLLNAPVNIVAGAERTAPAPPLPPLPVLSYGQRTDVSLGRPSKALALLPRTDTIVEGDNHAR